jgi:hypothetical protein
MNSTCTAGLNTEHTGSSGRPLRQRTCPRLASPQHTASTAAPPHLYSTCCPLRPVLLVNTRLLSLPPSSLQARQCSRRHPSPGAGVERPHPTCQQQYSPAAGANRTPRPSSSHTRSSRRARGVSRRSRRSRHPQEHPGVPVPLVPPTQVPQYSLQSHHRTLQGQYRQGSTLGLYRRASQGL